MRRALVVVTSAWVAALASLTAAPAHAQTTTTLVGYPPGACVTPTGTQNGGSHAVGETFTIVLTPVCAFTGTVTVTVNGVAVATKTPVNGTVRVTITIVSETLISVDDPVLVPINCGVPVSVTAAGLSGNTTVSQTAVFVVPCPGQTRTNIVGVAGPPGPPGPAGQQQQQQQQQQLPGTTAAPVVGTVVTPGTTTTVGRLAFTGSNALLLGVAALALVAVGSALALVKVQEGRNRA